MILSTKISIDYMGFFLLIEGISETILSNLNCVEALLAKGADPNAIDMFAMTALDHVVYSTSRMDSKQIEIFVRLDARGAKLSDTFQGSLCWDGSNLHALAIRNDLTGLAMMLLEFGHYAANQINTCGRTPLHTAVFFGNPKMIKVLLRYGADPTKPDNCGATPLELVPRLNKYSSYRAVYHLLRDWLHVSTQRTVPTSYAGYRAGFFHQLPKPKASANIELQNSDQNLSSNNVTKS